MQLQSLPLANWTIDKSGRLTKIKKPSHRNLFLFVALSQIAGYTIHINPLMEYIDLPTQRNNRNVDSKYV
jgi:hypothetical protein